MVSDTLEDDEQNFPLAAVGINITKIVMDQWAAGHLESLEDRFGVCLPCFQQKIHEEGILESWMWILQ